MQINNQKTRIAFVSYCLENQRYFRAMLKALPADVDGRDLGVRQRDLSRLESLLIPAQRVPPVPADMLETLIAFDLRLLQQRHPSADPRGLRQRLNGRATQWYYYFLRKLRDVDLLVIWNGFSIPNQAAIVAARALGLEVAHCELGALPGTLAIDPQGINAGNSLAGLTPDFLQCLTIIPERAQALFTAALPQRPLRKTRKRLSTSCDDDRPLPAQFVLFAMQVHDDTQLLMYSPRFATMEASITYTAEQLRRYCARTGASLTLVVKEHPSDFGRVDYTALRNALPDVLFLRSTPIRPLLERAAAVITINSSVGIEAMLHFRPVITLGQAYYNIPGVAYHLETGAELEELLERALHAEPDRELITRFLYFLREIYLIPGSYWAADAATMSPAISRLLDILHHRVPWLHANEANCSAKAG